MTFERAIASRAVAAGVPLSDEAIHRLANHARAVLAANDRLHLTAITDLEAFVDRHIGESLQGAALLEPAVAGTLLDLGSGNGYPGIPIGEARPGLRVILAESRGRKAAFLRELAASSEPARFEVLESNVRRGADLELVAPLDVLVTRAMGGWESAVPRLSGALRDHGTVLIWAGAEASAIVERASWRKSLRLAETVPLAGRDKSFIFKLIRVNS